MIRGLIIMRSHHRHILHMIGFDSVLVDGRDGCTRGHDKAPGGSKHRGLLRFRFTWKPLRAGARLPLR